MLPSSFSVHRTVALLAAMVTATLTATATTAAAAATALSCLRTRLWRMWVPAHSVRTCTIATVCVRACDAKRNTNNVYTVVVFSIQLRLNNRLVQARDIHDWFFDFCSFKNIFCFGGSSLRASMEDIIYQTGRKSNDPLCWFHFHCVSDFASKNSAEREQNTNNPNREWGRVSSVAKDIGDKCCWCCKPANRSSFF